MAKTRISLGLGLGALAAAAGLFVWGPGAAEAQPSRRGPPLSEPVQIGEPPLGADDDPAAYDVPGQWVVDAHDDLDAEEIADLAADHGVVFVPTDLEPETRIEIATVSGATHGDAIARLARDPRVQFVEPLAKVRAFFEPNDPLYKEQWHMTRVGAPKAWDFATGRGVTVAVVDTGIACEDHGPFTKGTDLLQTTCVGGWNFVANNEHANDDQGHGSHVAGTIAQSTNNAVGAVGLAFHARLMPVKVLNELGWGTTADVADGIRWSADHGADVINLSLGGPRNSKVLQDAVDHAVKKGVIVVAAAGNSGGKVGFPGASEGVIGVSATGPDDKIAKFSSRGDGVDVAAPGVNVVQQTVCNRGRDKCERFPGFSGTSMASPHVAGAAALLVGLGVTDPAAVEKSLKASARVVDETPDAPKLYGAGILDAAASVQRVTMVHALLRLALVAAFTALVVFGALRVNRRALSTWHPGYWLGALATGPGLFFFAPWILSRASLPVDLLARPLADLDLLVGTSVHQFLPLANAVIPFLLTLVAFGSRLARPAVAGVAVGTAAYLGSVALLAESSGPFGFILLAIWCVGNALACLWIARLNLSEA